MAQGNFLYEEFTENNKTKSMTLLQFREQNFGRVVSAKTDAKSSQTEKMSDFHVKQLFHLKMLENYIYIDVARVKTLDSVILAMSKNLRSVYFVWLETRGPL